MYTTQAVTQPNGLQAYRTACYRPIIIMLTTSIVNVCVVFVVLEYLFISIQS